MIASTSVLTVNKIEHRDLVCTANQVILHVDFLLSVEPRALDLDISHVEEIGQVCLQQTGSGNMALILESIGFLLLPLLILEDSFVSVQFFDQMTWHCFLPSSLLLSLPLSLSLPLRCSPIDTAASLW